MNVYDFDGTIYDGDSTKDFYLFCLKKDIRLCRFWFTQLNGAIQYFFKKKTKTEFKELFYSFLNGIDDIDVMVDDFWKSHSSKLFSWYLHQKSSHDIIITASPEFLIKPIGEQLHVDCVIASIVDPVTGKYYGKNCRGKEKVNRFMEKYYLDEIDSFYSDSQSDLPLAQKAKNSFLVKNGKVCVWNI